MAVVNAVGNLLTGLTGTGTFVGSISPTFTGIPILAAPSATSLTFSSTSGIIGTTTNDDAAAGSVGQIIESTVLSGAAVPLTTATAADITSISLTAGDWDVWGMVQTLPDGGTTTSSLISWINTTSAGFPTIPNGGAWQSISGLSVAAGSAIGLSAGTRRYSVAGATTVYLSTFCTFATSTMAAYGYIGARRRR